MNYSYHCAILLSVEIGVMSKGRDFRLHYVAGKVNSKLNRKH